jgi:uncharacterized protein
MSATRTAPEANAATVAQMYEAFGRGDVDAILARLSRDIVWNGHSPQDSAQAAGVSWLKPRRGHEEVAGFFSELASGLEFHGFDVRRVTAAGDTVVCEVVAEIESRVNGYRAKSTDVHVWTFDEQGLGLTYDVYVDTMHAIRGAGLEG